MLEKIKRDCKLHCDIEQANKKWLKDTSQKTGWHIGEIVNQLLTEQRKKNRK